MKKLDRKLKVGILGGTGMVGQRFITLLEDHPWFEVTTIAASQRSSGQRYEEAVEGRWKLEAKIPDKVKDIVVKDIQNIDEVAGEVDFVFCAVDMPKDEIRAIEEAYARTETPVVSNNSAHRWTEDVPMVIPEINPEHFDIIKYQKRRLGTSRGFIAVKPNCSIQGYMPALAAWREFEPTEVNVCTYQAISGAGKNFETWPEMVENVIPFISGEEEKSEKEPLKIFGHVEGEHIQPAEAPLISAQCVRIPVLDGHTAACSVSFGRKVSKEELILKLKEYRGFPQEADLPSAPKQFIRYFEEDDRPQVKADVDYERGFGVTMGRLREDTLFDYKFIGLAHNTVRGAAGGAILMAETLVEMEYIQAK
jgi:aspartate-semialdehyde dehydrogenase